MNNQSKPVMVYLIRLILIISALLVVLLVAGNLDAAAGTLVPPQMLAVFPESSSHTAEVTTPISITYDQDMNPITVNPHTFVVQARQTGHLFDMPEVEGGMIVLQPEDPLHAGELVQVSATTSTLNMEGEGPVEPTVWQFTTAPWGGNAYFHSKQFYPDGVARNAALGDLDGDGDLDAITVSCIGLTRVLHNDGSGIFAQVQDFVYSGYCLLDVQVGDLDGDGDLDAVLFDLALHGSRVLMNNGNGTFIDSDQSLGKNEDGYAELGDLDGDGDLDIFVVAGGFGMGTIHTWENDGTGVFTLMDDFDTSYSHISVALGDLDNDGDLDAFTSAWNLDNPNKVWLNDGTGEFTEAQSIPIGNTYGVQLGDLDSDGDLDVYLSKTTYGVTNLPDEVWLNDGTGYFVDSGQSLPTAFSVWTDLGDLDSDGDLDVYIAGAPYEQVNDEIWENDGEGNFTLLRTLNDNQYGGGVKLGDLDSDGNLDAFVIGGDEGYQVMLNGDWTQATPPPVALAADLVQCPNDPDSFYMVGGVLPGNITSNRLYRYDINTGEWVRLADLPAPRRAVAAACYHGKIYAAGGLSLGIEKRLYLYDILANSWATGPDLPDPIWGAAMGAWDGKLYVVGGTRIDYPYTPVSRVDVFDIATGEWTAEGGESMPVAASFFGSVQTGPYLYAVGGSSGDPAHNVDQTQRYDMATNNWEIGPQFTSARSLVPLAASSSHLYALGGDQNGGTPFDVIDQVEYLDLSTWPSGAWTELDDPLPQPNIYAASTCSEVLTGGEIWAVGGGDEFVEPYDTNLYYPIAEPCVSYGVELPEPMFAEAEAGAYIEYTLSITNTGVVTDYFYLDIDTTWGPGLPLGGPVMIGPGETIQIVTGVEVPADAMWGDLGITEITAASMSNPSATDSTTITTRVLGYQVDITPDPPDPQAGHPGEVLTYTLQVSNIGDFVDSYTVIISATWETSTLITVGPLLPDEEGEMLVSVEIPQDALHWDWDEAVITLISQADARVSDSVKLTTTAIWHRMLMPLAFKE